MCMKKVILIILDGWGIAKNASVSAIERANTPFVDSLYHLYPTSKLEASGMKVGLPEGQMGNSEVGHMNLGAGRIVYQDLVRINKDIEDGGFYQNPLLNKALFQAKATGRPLHIMGLVSDGGVHAHVEHIKALATAAKKSGIRRVNVHAFTDGRDTDPKGGVDYLSDLQDHLAQNNGKIVSVIGRYYAMDRDRRWERIKRAYDLLVYGKGKKALDAIEALEAEYARDITDEFINPIWLGSDDDVIRPGDVVINANFRTDRGRQITMALTQQAYPENNMEPIDIHYFTFTRYDESFRGVSAFYDKDNLRNTLGEVLAKNAKKQIRIAETEKYPWRNS
jgi:2,3-bisphosphoglycerate-independent phosphoglycerate mutase